MAGTLRFIAGRAGSGKTALCEREIAEEIARAALGPACVLLLPEHMTYRIERELAEKLRGSGFLRAYVFGFRRFARQVLLGTGGLLRPRISEVGRRLMLRRILTQEEKSLAFFRRAAHQRGFGATLSETLKELKSYGLTPETMRKASEVFAGAEDALAEKLEDLALLSERFAEAMNGRYDDAEDMMNLLIERLPSSSFIRGAKIWVDGFIFFNPQEQNVLLELLAAGCDVTVTLPLDPEVHSPENTTDVGLFYRSQRTKDELTKLAEKAGVRTKTESLDDTSHRFQSPGLSAIERGLFRAPVVPQETGSAGVQIVEAANRRIEVEAVAADILRLAREQHLRWRDIGILVRDEEGGYDGLLKLVLRDHAIPFFVDGQREAVHHPLAELIRSALEAVYSWRPEPIIRALRTGFFPVTREQIDKLENYVLAFGVRGEKRWTMEEAWPWFRRYSLDDADELPEDKQKEMLAEIDAIRKTAIAPLMTLAAQWKNGKTMRDDAAAVYAFLEALAVPATLTRWAEENEKDDHLASAAEHRQVWEKILELLDQLVEVGGEEAVSRKDFMTILGDGLDALQMKIIPPGLDQVTVAPFDQNSLMNAKALYILGANEGVMPRRSHEKGLFSDADRQRLKDHHFEIASGGLESSLAEKFLLYRGFTEATDYLWISYALADSDDKGLTPSPYIGRLRRLLPDAAFLSLPLEHLETMETPDATELSQEAVIRIADGRTAVTGLSAALRGLRERGMLAPYWRDVYNWARQQESLAAPLALALSGLFAKAPDKRIPENVALELFAREHCLRGSVTRLEQYAKCPFSYFAKYGLKLKEREEQGFHGNDFGMLMHSCLRNIGADLRAAGRSWKDVGVQEREVLVQDVMKKIVPRLQNRLLLSTKAYEHLLARIHVTAMRTLERLIAFDRVSKFHPVAFERLFGRGGDMPPLTYGLSRGARLELTGQIDRIDFDEEKKYYLVIDYKTGRGEVALNLIHVYYGIQLQLLTYLIVTRNLVAKKADHEMLPAGILYCLVRNKWWNFSEKMSTEDMLKKIDQKLRMPGWVLLDPEVVEALDASGRFFHVNFKKDGSPCDNQRPKVKTLKEFEALMRYIELMLRRTGDRILAGDIAAAPYQEGKTTACKFCDYASVCGFDPVLDGCSFRRIGGLGYEELMDAIELDMLPPADDAGTLEEKGGDADGLDA
ncbi:helicase-exonuclease AddAB subunit AddB [uncultured Selenomonas sp.]|uniref:helicase-exonuclease AddAB subunit AddB n=1 Tax=uncultured Selenomonas sp. TaxID=159275 RepID=UPI0025FC5123|nr:helicase-exonuclease AddAB subunit AddB [uncultured Selenomonas sp.]